MVRRIGVLVVAVVGALALSGLPAPAASGTDATPPSWATVAPMPTARCGLAATAALDGRVFALGGGCSGGGLDTVESFDPTTGRWTSEASLPTGRRFLAAATGADGRIYAIGGVGTEDGGERYLGTVQAYTPSTRTWATVAPMPTPRAGLALAAGADGRIYAIGGCCDPTTNHLFTTVEVYRPETNTWTTTTPLPTARAWLAAASGFDGRIYAIGGRIDPDNTNCCPVANVDAYDPATGGWRTAAALPAPVESLAAATGADGRIYAIGGDRTGPPTFVADVSVYDPAADAWAATTPMSVARNSLAAARAGDGRILAVGGANARPDSTLAVLDLAEALTPSGPAVPDRADVTVRLDVPHVAAPGAAVTIRLKLTNRGPATARHPVAALALPSGLRFSTADGGGVRFLGLVVWTPPDLAPGQQRTFTVTARAATRTGRQVVVGAGLSRTPDPHVASNLAIATVTIG